MATINGKKVTVYYGGIKGHSLTDLNYHSPAEVKAKIADAQKAIKALLDVTNGEGGEFMNTLFNKAYEFENYIGKFVADVPTTVRKGTGEVIEEDFSDVPFIREYDDDFCVKQFVYDD